MPKRTRTYYQSQAMCFEFLIFGVHSLIFVIEDHVLWRLELLEIVRVLVPMHKAGVEGKAGNFLGIVELDRLVTVCFVGWQTGM
jgi:hypothetical protein